MVEGLGVTDDAAESRSGGFWEGEEAVVDREEELADDVDCRVAEEEVEVAGDGTDEGVLEGDDGRGVSGGWDRRRSSRRGPSREFSKASGAPTARRPPPRPTPPPPILPSSPTPTWRQPSPPSPDALVGDADWAVLAAGRGGRRVVAGAEDLAVSKEALEGHLEAEAGGEVPRPLWAGTAQALMGQHGLGQAVPSWHGGPC